MKYFIPRLLRSYKTADLISVNPQKFDLLSVPKHAAAVNFRIKPFGPHYTTGL